jgi:hypothetical protein
MGNSLQKQPIDNQTLCQIILESAKISEDSFSALDWNALAHKAHAEGIGPLLYWKLSKSEQFSSLPEETRNFLRILYAGTKMQNQRRFKDLKTLSNLFYQANISAVVLKGACFALTIYPDIGLRPMSDMDLLIPKAKLAEAARIAKGLGYEEVRSDAFPSLRNFLEYDIVMLKRSESFNILELHNSVLANKAFTFAVPVEWFWTHTEPLSTKSNVDFENLSMLSPTVQVLYTSAHAILKHGEHVLLRWYFDLDLLVRFYDARIDWDFLLSQAQAFKWSSALSAALLQTHSYFDTPIPGQILARLAESSDRYSNWVALMQEKPATRTLEELRYFWVKNWYGRIIMIAGLVIPSPSYMRWRYKLKSSWLLLVYYPFRWWGILKDAVRTVF